MGALSELYATRASAAARPSVQLPRMGVEQDDRTGSGLFGFLGNLGADVADLVGGVAGLIGTGLTELWDQPTNVAKEFLTLGFADTPVQVATPAVIPALGEALVTDVKDRYLEGDIAEEMYDHPLSFLLDVTAVAGGAGAAARAATGTGKIYGALGRAVFPEARITENAGLLALAREARVARASEGIETLADTVRRFDALPPATRRKAQWLDRLVTEPMRVADPTSGFTFQINPTRNPLIRAAWSDPIRRKHFVEGVPMFEKEVTRLQAIGDELPPAEARRLANMEAALGRMREGGAQYVATKRYGTVIARSALKKAARKVISDVKMRGITSRQDALGDLEQTLRTSGVAPEVMEEMHLVLEGLRDERISSLDPATLESQLRDKGFADLAEAAEEMVHRTGRHMEFDTDERNSLWNMLHSGQIEWEGLWRYQPAADLVPLPQRGIFEAEFRGALSRLGMPVNQQDLSMAAYDSVARRIAEERYGGDVDAFYRDTRVEFRDKWQAGVRDELFQRANKVLRGTIRYRNGKPWFDVKRMAKVVEGASPEDRNWYANQRAWIADITRGSYHVFPNGRKVRDSELLADLLAATSIGVLPEQQLGAALQLWLMIKDGSYERAVWRTRRGRAGEIINPWLEGPEKLTWGQMGPRVAQLVDEIAHGHLIRDWEAEIQANKADMILDDTLDLARRDAPLDMDSRQKVRAYASRLRGDEPDTVGVIDRRINLFFGIFSGQNVWEAVTGQIRPSKRPYDIPYANRGARYRQLSEYLRETRDYLNSRLGPGDVPYSMEEVQSSAWGQTQEFLIDEAQRVRKRLYRIKDPVQRGDLKHYLDMVTASITDQMPSTGYDVAWEKLLQTEYGQAIGRKLMQFLDDPRELAQ
ncbi:MAG TPA: hypothetical protein VFQ40_07570, partial [Actinomycetota bacterium]|nr:hypothetical protein [Actinomycetota bacterium]